MATAAASSSRFGWQAGTFHVFVSFRGTDVRNAFLSHLYHALVREGIRAYVDDEELPRGDEIGVSLEKAIEESRIALILFSENYASSRWCLNELAKIMERRKEGKLAVKPVFYRVDPRELRTPRMSFAEALDVHERQLGKESNKVKQWREALAEAGNLSGWRMDSNGDEAELVRTIVEDINAILDRIHVDVAKYPVGIESRVEQIKLMLELGSDEVRFVGLWGMGGVGKTTLAKAIFNAIANQFDGCCLLLNVRECSANPSFGLAKLQENLLSEVLRRKDVSLSSVDHGVSLIRDRLHSKNVLLILDDVDDSEQLDALAGGLDWFGIGSRVLVTTRDASLLRQHAVHKVETLACHDALQLFSRHAFLDENREDITQDLVDICLDYSSGLPLALVVLGSMLRGRPAHHWKSTMKLLKKSPYPDINCVLRLSFDGLNSNTREIFLDIACFFKGKRRSNVEKVLEACGFEASLGIQILIERSLITVSNEAAWNHDYEIVEMHDLIQLMGKSIVNEKHPDKPGLRSRLWLYKDVLHVLSNGAGTDAVNAIVLRLSSEKNIRVAAGDVLTKMNRLRILIMVNVKFGGDPICFPRGLCWIEWPGYSAPSIHFSGDSNNPVMLDVHNSCIRNLSTLFKHLVRLKCINLSGCVWLTEIPDLSPCRNLEILDLSQCTSLVAVDDSVGYLKKLIELSLGGCSNLAKLPDKLRCRYLEVLYLRGCSKLAKLPNLSACRKLEVLDLSGCESLLEVDDSVGYLEMLAYLPLEGCKNIARLPNRLKWRSLETFRLKDCYKLEKFPEIIEVMKCLKELILLRSRVKELPASTENLISVRRMNLEGSQDLVNIPSSIHKLKNLEKLNLRGCLSLEKFPRYIEGSTGEDSFGFPSLLSLDLSRCNLSDVEFLSNIHCFPKLRELYLSENDSITEIPSLAHLSSLEKLCVHECERLADIAELPANLRVLDANGCGSLRRIQGLLPSRIPSFKEINLSSCQELANQGFHLDRVLPLEEARNIRGNTNFVFTGSEVPHWMMESDFSDSVSFLVPLNTWDNLAGILACAVFDLEQGFFWKNKWFDVEVYVNEQYAGNYRYEFIPSNVESDAVWLLMLLRDQEVDCVLLRDELLGKTDSDHFTVSLGFRTIRGGVIKKCGFHLICKDAENELRASKLQEPVYLY